jgi:hypothetical protein
MNLKNLQVAVAVVVLSAPTMTGSVASAVGSQSEQSSTQTGATRTIEGVWRTVVTPRNCQTGEALGSLNGLFTFNEGGTMAEYGIGPGSSPALRSPGHGVWQREHGWLAYSFVFTFYRYDANGVFLGSQKVSAALRLGAGGARIATNSVIEILDPSDNLIGSGCATATATRFE